MDTQDDRHTQAVELALEATRNPDLWLAASRSGSGGAAARRVLLSKALTAAEPLLTEGLTSPLTHVQAMDQARLRSTTPHVVAQVVPPTLG
jgi:hypothetical protein